MERPVSDSAAPPATTQAPTIRSTTPPMPSALPHSNCRLLTPMLSTWRSVPLSRSPENAVKAEKNNHQRHQHLQDHGAAQVAKASDGTLVGGRSADGEVLLVRLHEQGRAGVVVDAVVEEGQRPRRLEGVVAVVRSGVRVLVALVQPLGVAAVLRQALHVHVGAVLLVARGHGGQQQQRHDAGGPFEPSVAHDFGEFLACNSSDHKKLPFSVHVLEIDLFHVGVADFAGAQLIHQAALAHDSDARARLPGAEQIMRGHEDGRAIGLELQQ